MMRKLFAIQFLLTIILTAYAANPVKQWGQLRVEGNQLCAQDGSPVVLRGASLGWHNLWPRFYNKECIKWLKNDWHATVIRAAMGTTIEDNYLENPEFALQCVEKVVDACIANGLYVIIDWHTYYPEKEACADFFGKMAKKYGKYPNVIYEIYNEPMEDSWESVKDYAHTVLKEIRKYDPDNIVIVGNPHWDQDLHIVAADPLKGYDNIMYTLHFYAATHKQNLRDVAEAAWKSGIPIFVTECAGMECTGDGPLDVEEWERWNEWMETHKISWVNWSVSDKNETCSMLIPRASKKGHWTDDVIKPYGKLVRKYLRKYNADLFTMTQSLDEIDNASFGAQCNLYAQEADKMSPVHNAVKASFVGQKKILLNGEWILSGSEQSNADVRVAATIPGSIHSALIKAGIIPDPMIGRNDTIAERCSYKSWTLSRNFYYDGKMSTPILSFQGIANKCRIILNGQEIACHEGMFGGPDVDVTNYIRKGDNTLTVELLPIPEVYNGGWPATANEAWKHTVVVNCVYGWHYSKIPSLGIWSDVVLHDQPQISILNPCVQTKSINGDMRLTFDTKASSPLQVRCSVRPVGDKKNTQTFVAQLNADSTTQVFDFHIDNPQLWWPNGYGSHTMYEACIELLQKGKTLSSTTTRFGIRTIEMKPLPGGTDEDTFNWTFCINGQDMFMKGTGWCTMDALLDFSHDRYLRFLSSAAQQHSQLIRAWGGGLPETDTFYNICDSLGIMVIQEWPTAWNSHNTQPYEMLEETVLRNTLRLRSHPSLIMWGGGNESDKPYGKAIDMMGRASIELDGSRPFHRSEAWGGSQHNYNCWWDNYHPNHNLNMAAPFWGEFGIPSLPLRETVEHYLAGEEYKWLPEKESVFTHHTPIFGTNGEIGKLEQYAGYFTSSDSLQSIILGSQLAQSEGVRHTLERARTLWPHTTGALYYKLNDNYPGLSWSTVDYYGRKKPAHYFIQKSFAPSTTVLLFDRTNYTNQEAELPYWYLDDNEQYKGKKMMAQVSVYNMKMAKVAEKTCNFISEGKVKYLGALELYPEQTDTEMLWYVTDLLTGDGTLVARNWYYTNYDSRKDIMFQSAKSTISIQQNGSTLVLKNTSEVPAVGINIEVPEYSDRLNLSDNFLWLNAGEEITITMNTDKKASVSWFNK